MLAASSILSTLASERPLTSMRVFLGTVSKDLTVTAKPASFTFVTGGKRPSYVTVSERAEGASEREGERARDGSRRGAREP